MRWVRRILLFLLVGLLLAWLFRGPLYRSMVTYRVVGVRTPVVQLHTSAAEVTDLDQANKASLKETASRLSFSTGRVSSDAQRLYDGGPANCIGYAALCASLLEDRLRRSGLADRYEVEHVVGKLYLAALICIPFSRVLSGRTMTSCASRTGQLESAPMWIRHCTMPRATSGSPGRNTAGQNFAQGTTRLRAIDFFFRWSANS